MPRGSRPGERRGGRKPGTPNKKTLLNNAVFLAAAQEPNRSPLEFMLALMRDPQVPLKDRVAMAEAAAPFVHARPRKPSQHRPHPMELRRAAKAAAQNGAANGAASGSEESPSLHPVRPDGVEQAALIGGGEAVVVRLTGAGPQGTECFEIWPPSPLDFLLTVIADPDAMPRERMRAAQVAARYKYSLADDEEPTGPVEDEFGFRIDPAVAKRVSQIKWQALGSDKQKQEALSDWLREYIEGIECPEKYGELDFQNDGKRLRELRERRGTKIKLSAEDDAEEAYLTTRAEVYRATPRHEACCAARQAEIDARNAQIARDIEWVHRRVKEDRAQSARIRDLALRRLDGEQTPAEEHEWEELRRQDPGKVERISKWALRQRMT